MASRLQRFKIFGDHIDVNTPARRCIKDAPDLIGRKGIARIEDFRCALVCRPDRLDHRPRRLVGAADPHQYKNIRFFTDFSAFSADKVELNRRLLAGNPAFYPRRIRSLYQIPIKCLRTPLFPPERIRL